MTHDSYVLETAKRRFGLLDSCVAALVVAALAAPFVAGWLSGGPEAGPQVAVRGDVSPIRAIDIAMGHNEEKAEAAFYEALGREPPTAAEEASSEAFDLTADAFDFADDLETAPVAEGGDTDGQSRPDAAENPDAETAIEAEQAEQSPPRVELPLRTSPVPGRHPTRPLRRVAEQQEPSAETKAVTPPSPRVDIEETPLAPLPPVGALPKATVPPPEAPESAEQTTTPKPSTSEQLSVPAKSGKGPKIALVITAAGLNESATRYAIDALPAGVTLAFAPVKEDVGKLAAEAKADGHTVFVEVPMEPVNKTRDPGPLTLRVANPVEENLDRLEEALSRVPAATGAASYLGARFNSVEGAASPIINALAKRGMFFFENQPTARSVLERLSVRSNLPYAKGVIVVDRSKSTSAIRASLDVLEKRARERGAAIGIGSTLRGTITAVENWIKEAQERGVEFVSVTEVGR